MTLTMELLHSKLNGMSLHKRKPDNKFANVQVIIAEDGSLNASWRRAVGNMSAESLVILGDLQAFGETVFQTPKT